MPQSDESREHAMGHALGDVARDLRRRYPAEYARADAVLADPTRERLDVWVRVDPNGWTTTWCAWCGDWFVTETNPNRVARTCSRSCTQHYRHWLARRARATPHTRRPGP